MQLNLYNSTTNFLNSIHFSIFLKAYQFVPVRTSSYELNYALISIKKHC